MVDVELNVLSETVAAPFESGFDFEQTLTANLKICPNPFLSKYLCFKYHTRKLKKSNVL